MGIVSGVLSSFVDTFTIAITDISLYPLVVADNAGGWVDADYISQFVLNGAYWKTIAYSTAVGGCLLSIGSTSGIALMKMEHVKLGWYLRTLTPKVLLGFVLGQIVLCLETFLF